MHSRIVALLIALAFPASGFAEITYSSQGPKRAYTTTITQEMLDRSLRWDDKEENPPLSARKAMEAANSTVAKLEPDTDFWKRRLDAIVLCNYHSQWYWRVEYEWNPPLGTGMGGLPPYMFVVVLMDGTVVTSKVSAAP